MNNREKLESRKRMYLWIEEQAKKNKYLNQEDKISDWETLENTYPELLMLVEDLISDLKTKERNNE